MCCFPVANHVHPRARVCMIYEKDKRQIPRKTSRGLNWEKNKTYKLKRSIVSFGVLVALPSRSVLESVNIGFWGKCENLSLRNNRQFATPPLFSPRNNVWETSAETPYWWRVSIPRTCLVEKGLQPIRSSTQFWVAARHQYRISALVPSSFRRECGVAKSRPLSPTTESNVNVVPGRSHLAKKSLLRLHCCSESHNQSSTILGTGAVLHWRLWRWLACAETR